MKPYIDELWLDFGNHQHSIKFAICWLTNSRNYKKKLQKLWYQGKIGNPKMWNFSKSIKLPSKGNWEITLEKYTKNEKKPNVAKIEKTQKWLCPAKRCPPPPPSRGTQVGKNWPQVGRKPSQAGFGPFCWFHHFWPLWPLFWPLWPLWPLWATLSIFGKRIGHVWLLAQPCAKLSRDEVQAHLSGR